MEKAQYAIMRFAKYKGPEIGNIEAHNKRTKEKYASNPDVDISRSKYNFHLVKPPGKYRTESERQIATAGCRTRKDSIRMIETLFTASPEFFKGKKRAEIRVFFEEALRFLEQHQSKETIISAVVHMDEKTPHMHLCMDTLLRKYGVAFTKTASENKKLKTENAELEESLASAQKVSTLNQIEDFKLRRDYDSAVAILEQIPAEVLEFYKQPHRKERENAYDR